jgi:hypothetical protein
LADSWEFAAMKLSALIPSTLLWICCGGAAQSPAATGSQSMIPQAMLAGRFDNSRQVAKAAVEAAVPIPHVVVVIEPLSQSNWSLWHVHLEVDAESTFDQTWAMQARIEHDGTSSLIPYYQFKQTEVPTAAMFDPQQWLSLEACALRGNSSKTRIQGMSEGEPCVAVTMSVGARRALLPVGLVREGEWLHLDLNLRGIRTRIDAHRT